MHDLVINSTFQYILLLFVPLVLAYILKQTNIRGWAMIGGAVGGILLGPSVLGSIAPNYWEGLFQGGSLQHNELIELQRQQKSDLLAATTIGVDESLLLQMRADQQFEQTVLVDRWKAAQWDEQRTIRTFSLLLIVLILFSGSIRGKAKGTAPPAITLSVGVWAAMIPSGLATLLVYWFIETNLLSALALGACLGAGPWTLAKWEERTADDAEQNGALLMLRCGRVAWVVAGTIAICVAWQLQGVMSLVWMLPLLVLPLIWLAPSRALRWFTLFVDYVAIPSVMASALVLIHPLESLQFWPILFVILCCADARWLGGMIGLGILGGRQSGSTMRLSIPLVDAGVSQMCMAAMLIGVGVLPAPLALATLIGAIFLEYTAPIRMNFTAKST